MTANRKVSVRALTPEERHQIDRLACSRTAPARLVERARIIQASAGGESVAAIAVSLNCSRPTVYGRIRRFNTEGLHALEERPRSGRPPTYTVEQRAEVIAAALTDPQKLGLPFGCWTLDRLAAYLNEQKGIPIKRSRIDEILLAEGLRWRKQETWFGERVDPEFAAKRGRSRNSTPRRPGIVSSSASTKWVPSRPRASRVNNRSTPVQPQGAKTRPGLPSGPNKRLTTGGAARVTSSGRSNRRPVSR